MTLEFKIILTAIIIEVSLIVFLVSAFYITKILGIIRLRQRRKLIAKIENQLNYLVSRNLPFIYNNFPKSWQHLDIILPIIEKFDTKSPIAAWETIKSDLIRNIILPLARRNAKSKKWISRLLAAKALTYLVEKKDEYILMNLINDQIPIVYEYAILAAVQFKSTVCINEVITKIAEERRLGQAIALKFFEAATLKIKTVIIERLETEKNSYIKAICYKILVKFPPAPLSIHIINDITSANLELALAALRFIAYNEGKQALSVLINNLTHSAWEMRAAAARELGNLDEPKAINALSICLRDSQWWVRINAAEAIKKLGPSGITLLAEQNSTIDKFAYETSQYILQSPS